MDSEQQLRTISFKDDSGIVTITLNRPEKKNAMSPQLHREMSMLFQTLTQQALDNPESVRVLILTGAGDSFCAGQDLKEFFYETKDNPQARDQADQASRSWSRQLRLFPAPTIAAVNGWCVGGGLRVMSLCDLAYASDRAKFTLSEVNFGLIPAGGATKAPSELLNARDLSYLALTGRTISANEANTMRLVNGVVPHERLMDEVYVLARELKQKNPIALRYAKQLIIGDRYLTFDQALDYENAKVHEMADSQEGVEWIDKGVRQFMDKKFKPGTGSSYERKE